VIDGPYIDMLAEKAQVQVQTRENGTYETRQFNMVFAAMIVDICIDLVEDGVEHREPASTYADKIKDYFGLGLTADDTMRNRSTYYGNNP
jgi:hypothetical protein